MISFIIKDLLHHRGQTLFNILGLAVVVFTFILLTGLIETVDDIVRKTSLNRNLVIIQSDAVMVDESTIPPEVISAAQALIPATLSRVSPLIFRNIRINGKVVNLRAAAVQDWEPVFHLNLIEGKLPSGPDQVAVGEGTKIANGWGLGTNLSIYGKDFTVTGIFQSPGIIFASVWMPIETARELFAPRRASQLLVMQTAPGSDAEAVRTQLEQTPFMTGKYAVFFEDYISRRNAQAISDIGTLLRIISAIALASIVFGSYNLTSLSLEERFRDTAILRGLGFSPSTIRAALALRAAFLGLLAYLLGLLAACLYTLFANWLAPIYVLSYPFIYHLTIQNVLIALGWMLILPALGAWLTTRRMLQESVTFSLQRPS